MRNEDNFTFLNGLGIGPSGVKRKMEMEAQLGEAMFSYLNEHKGEISKSMVKNYFQLARKGTNPQEALIYAGISAVSGQALIDIFKWAKRNYWD